MVLLESTVTGGSSQAERQQQIDDGTTTDADGTSTNVHVLAQATAATSMSATTCSSARGSPISGMAKDGIAKEITRGVIRAKLAKMRHLVIQRGIRPAYLDGIMPAIIDNFNPQTVTYNGGIAKVKEWKLSCYMEVMEGGVPCADPDLKMLDICLPLLECCDDLFASWYRQQHSCNDDGGRRKIPVATTTKGKGNDDSEGVLVLGEENIANGEEQAPAGPGGNNEKATQKQKQQQRQSTDDGVRVKRLMTFITRYTAAPNENALLKHVDGAGKVDGSVVVALPIDRWTGSEEQNSFEGHGGGLTFWDGKSRPLGRPQEIQYDTRSGDLAFIDR